MKFAPPSIFPFHLKQYIWKISIQIIWIWINTHTADCPWITYEHRYNNFSTLIQSVWWKVPEDITIYNTKLISEEHLHPESKCRPFTQFNSMYLLKLFLWRLQTCEWSQCFGIILDRRLVIFTFQNDNPKNLEYGWTHTQFES